MLTGKRQRNNKRRVPKYGTLQPGPYVPTIIVSKVFRFQAASALSGYVVQTRDLGDMLCVAVTATSAYQLAKAIRVRKVEMWGVAGQDGRSGSTISIDWLGGTAGTIGSNIKQSDSTIGTARIPHLVSKPNKMSQAAQWQAANQSPADLFSITLPANGVIDVHLSLVLLDDAGVNAVTAAVAGATVGQLYCRALASNASTSSLPPVSFPTI